MFISTISTIYDTKNINKPIVGGWIPMDIYQFPILAPPPQALSPLAFPPLVPSLPFPRLPRLGALGKWDMKSMVMHNINDSNCTIVRVIWYNNGIWYDIDTDADIDTDMI